MKKTQGGFKSEAQQSTKVAGFKLMVSATCLVVLAACGGGTGTGTTGGAVAGCYNTARYLPGDQVIRFTNHTPTYAGTTSTYQSVEQVDVLGPVSFNGYTTPKLATRSTGGGSTQPLTTSELLAQLQTKYQTQTPNYSYEQFDGTSWFMYGYESLYTNAGFLQTDVTTYNPAPSIQFVGISAGNVQNITWSSSTVRTVGGVASAPTQNTGTAVFTYKGVENVTTPAGTFSACRMDSSSTGNSSTTGTWSSSDSEWRSVKDGIVIKRSSTYTDSMGSNSTLDELTSGTINGVAIVP